MSRCAFCEEHSAPPAREPARYTLGDLQRLFGVNATELGFAMRRGDLPAPVRRDAFGLPQWDRAAVDALLAQRRGAA